MNQARTVIEIDKVFDNHRDGDLILGDKDGSEISWQWPKEFGTGKMSRIKLRTGLVLGSTDFQVLDDFSISYDHMFMPVTFNFCATWPEHYFILCKDEHNDLRVAGPGCGSVIYRPVWNGEMFYPRGVPIRSLTISLDPSLLNSFMDDRNDNYPKNLIDIACGDCGKSFEQTFVTMPSVNLAVHQVFDCPYKGPLKRFFLEAKTLELITFAMSQLVHKKRETYRASGLHPTDVKRAQDIKEILLHNLEKPPSLLELARQCGTNKNKLNSDFRQVFGTNVFEFLRNSRLKYAKDLLECGDMSVSEVAFEVGYEHARNFARAFKNHFGTNPKDHLF